MVVDPISDHDYDDPKMSAWLPSYKTRPARGLSVDIDDRRTLAARSRYQSHPASLYSTTWQGLRLASSHPPRAANGEGR